MNHETAVKLIDDQFAQESLSAEDHEALREHIGQCAGCRRRYDQTVRMERALADHVVPQAQVDRLLARGAPIRARRPERRWLRAVGPALAVAAAASLVVLARPDSTNPASQKMSRGLGPEGRTSWVKIYRATEDEIIPLEETLRQGDGLLFSYTSLKNSHARYLMIVGLDTEGRAHWYHPAYTDAAEDPESIRITPGAINMELKERVFAEYALGKLRVCALFSAEPLRVKDIDEVLERSGSLPIVGTLDCREVEVVP